MPCSCFRKSQYLINFKLVEREKELFCEIAKTISKLDNLSSKLNPQLTKKVNKAPYDPTKYIRGEFLITKPELDKEKGTYAYKDWVEKQRSSSIVQGGNTNVGPNPPTFQQVFQENKAPREEAPDISNNQSKIIKVDTKVFNPYGEIENLVLKNDPYMGLGNSQLIGKPAENFNNYNYNPQVNLSYKPDPMYLPNQFGNLGNQYSQPQNYMKASDNFNNFQNQFSGGIQGAPVSQSMKQQPFGGFQQPTLSNIPNQSDLYSFNNYPKK